MTNRKKVLQSISKKIIAPALLPITNRPVIPLYEKVIKKSRQQNPYLSAAEALFQKLQKENQKRTVIIVTGFPILSAQKDETDGPLGAAVIAELLLRHNINVRLFTNPHSLTVTQKPVSALHLDKELVSPYPITTKEKSKLFAEKIINQLKPSAIIFIERPGRNARGVYHNMHGKDITSLVGKSDYLVNFARKKEILTIGIGDGGNEVGMGMIESVIQKFVPYGKKCRCPCKSGIASNISTDHLLVASVSNWGAYAFAAIFSLLAQIDYTHSAQLEENILNACIMGGGVDGLSGKKIALVDGFSGKLSCAIASLIYEITTKESID